MEISQQFLIDMALNIGGYLLAGILGVVVYSMFKRRKKATLAAADERNIVTVDSPTEAAQEEPGARRLEFIKLAEKPASAAQVSNRTGNTSARRDRADIIRVARTMLKAGATPDKIKRVIPISDAELSLLSMSKS